MNYTKRYQGRVDLWAVVSDIVADFAGKRAFVSEVNTEHEVNVIVNTYVTLGDSWDGHRSGYRGDEIYDVWVPVTGLAGATETQLLFLTLKEGTIQRVTVMLDPAEEVN